MTPEQEWELMRRMMRDLIEKVDTFVEAAEKRDAEYHKLRERVLKGALGLLGTDESEGAEPGV